MNKGMRCSLHLLLLLLATDQFVRADRAPQIVVAPSHTVVMEACYGRPARAGRFNFRGPAAMGPLD
jgi:hypothetical protein